MNHLLVGIVVLAGGTGSIKLLRGLRRVVDEDVTVICNVGDNIWLHGLYVCPDIDTVLYGLSGLLDKERGWGVAGDSFQGLEQMEKLGLETWFRLGDKDLALHIFRTQMLKSGKTLSQVTDNLSVRLGLTWKILPASDQSIETMIETLSGDIHLQEFWVRDSAKPKVISVKYRGAEAASPAPRIVDLIMQAEKVLICPGNPVTSVNPILAVHDITESLKKTPAKIIAVSPIIGDKPVSGPAGLLMPALGFPVSPIGVARMYSSFLDSLVIHDTDSQFRTQIEELGISVHLFNIIMSNESDEEILANYVLEA